MAFQDLMRRLLATDIALAVLLALSYAGILATGAPLSPETATVIQLGGLVLTANFFAIAGVLYTGWTPV